MQRRTYFITLLQLLLCTLVCLSCMNGQKMPVPAAVHTTTVEGGSRQQQVSGERQHPFSTAHIGEGQACYVFGTRSFRSLSFHGSGLGRNLGNCRAVHHLRLCQHSDTHLPADVRTGSAGAASPRNYYVIALRRILC